MKCMNCGAEIPEEFFAQKSQSTQFRGGRFACPHCGVEHLRRQVGQLHSGEPMYSFRLWGHLITVGKHVVSAEGVERRQVERHRPWR
jgi:hypothetical protein